MEQNKKTTPTSGRFATIYKMASGVIIAALLVIGAVVFPLSFESGSRYMVTSPIVIALYVAIGLTVAYALSSFFLLRGLMTSPSCTTSKRIAASLSALASAVPFIYYIYSDLSARLGALSADLGSPAASYSGLDTLSALITVAAAISLICSLYLVIRQSKIAALIAGYSRVIFLALIITKLYLDFSVELNSPVKIIVQFAAAAAMMATVATLRPIARRCRAAAFTSAQLISAALCLLCFTLFAFEIAPHSAKYSADLVAFPLMLLIFGIESAVLLFTCRISPISNDESVPQDTPIEVGSNESSVDTPEISDQ